MAIYYLNVRLCNGIPEVRPYVNDIEFYTDAIFQTMEFCHAVIRYTVIESGCEKVI